MPIQIKLHAPRIGPIIQQTTFEYKALRYINSIKLNVKMKIALIIPYFGKLPQWSDLFFYSVMKNAGLDFYFFTDIDFDEKYLSLPNVFVEKTSWNDYCDTVSKKLNIDFHPQKAYKLCDLRPFYGYIYQDLLKAGFLNGVEVRAFRPRQVLAALRYKGAGAQLDAALRGIGMRVRPLPGSGAWELVRIPVEMEDGGFE